MDRKYLPLILMLSGGAVISIIAFVRDYTLLETLIALLIVFLIFYAFGSIIKWLLDLFDRQNAKAALDAGEVFEKEKSGESDSGKESTVGKES